MPVLCQGRGVTLPESGPRLWSGLVGVWTPERARLGAHGGYSDGCLIMARSLGMAKARLTRERPEPDAVVLDHGELTDSLRTAREGGHGNSNGVLW